MVEKKHDFKIFLKIHFFEKEKLFLSKWKLTLGYGIAKDEPGGKRRQKP